jgi:orotidine-5'-phosphate decarboxylase
MTAGDSRGPEGTPDHAVRAASGRSQSWPDRLAARSGAVNSVLCLGLDPDPASLPPGFSRDIAGVEAFARLILDVALPFAAAVKPNLAFYEAFGSGGIALLERLRAVIPDDVPLLIDAKRGDIGSTAERQAAAIVDGLGAHAVTLNPYMGRDVAEPFLARGKTFVYLVCRTSNPAAGKVQGIVVPRDDAHGWPLEPLYARVARTTTAWAPADRLGFVVGATAPAELAALRAIVPERAFLVPGIGAQGGDLEATLRDGPARAGELAARSGAGLLVNVARGIAGAGEDPSGTASRREVEARIRAAAADWAAKMPVLSLAGA